MGKMRTLCKRISRFVSGVKPFYLPIKAAKIIRGRIHQRYFSSLAKKLREIKHLDHKLGVNFGGWISQKDLGTDSQLSASYEPSYFFGGGMISQLPISEVDAVIDIGCGKGLAMYYLGKLPFGRVDGVELSDKLCSVCRKNFQHLYGEIDRFHVYQTDASLFLDLDCYNYVYMYNPFRASIMAEFLKNLLKSMQRKPRKVYLLYQNPTCHQIIMESGIFKPMGYDGPVLVYTNSYS